MLFSHTYSSFQSSSIISTEAITASIDLKSSFTLLAKVGHLALCAFISFKNCSKERSELVVGGWPITGILLPLSGFVARDPMITSASIASISSIPKISKKLELRLKQLLLSYANQSLIFYSLLEFEWFIPIGEYVYLLLSSASLSNFWLLTACAHLIAAKLVFSHVLILIGTIIAKTNNHNIFNSNLWFFSIRKKWIVFEEKIETWFSHDF